MKHAAFFVDTLRRHYQGIALFTVYIAFACACYLFVQLGFVLVFGFVLPEAWWGLLAFSSADSYALHFLKFGLKFAVALTPVLTIVALSMAWFARLFQFKPVRLSRLALSVPVNVGIALPFFLLIPPLAFIDPFKALFPFLSQAVTYPASLVTAFFGVALVYLVVSCSLTSRSPAQFARAFLSSGRFWLAFTVTCILLALALLNLLDTLLVSVEHITRYQFETLVVTAVPVAFVAPALPLVVEYFGNQGPLK